MLYTVVLVSAIHQHGSAIGIHISPRDPAFMLEFLLGDQDYIARSVHSIRFYLNTNDFLDYLLFSYNRAFPLSKMFLKGIMFKTKFYRNIYNVLVFSKVGSKYCQNKPI